MNRVLSTAVPVWSPGTFPVAIRTAAGWQFGLREPIPWNRAPKSAVLEMLSDLASYGLVAGACGVGEDTLAWPGVQDSGADSGASYPRLAHTDTADWTMRIAPDALRAEFVAASADVQTHVPSYALTASARAAAARLRIPFVNTALLALIASTQMADRGTRAPRGETPPTMPELVVPFPRTDASAFVAQLKPAIRRALAVQRKVLRERRRLILGLPVGVADDVLDEQIETRLVVPLARHYIEGCVGEPGKRIHLVAGNAAGKLADRPRLNIAVSHFEADGPAGENIFALALRRLFYQNFRSAGSRYFDITPFTLGRRVSRQAPCLTGMGHAMLAALQMQFLESKQVAGG